jgi:hypothetical protein
MIFLLTFQDISDSLDCQKAFKRAGVKSDIDNVPTGIGLNCGYAVSCEAFDITEIHKILHENNVICSKIVSM